MWSNIIGQKRSVLLLRHAMHEQRVAHAYCFFGPEAVACEALALAFAQALNCAKPVDESPCGTCKSCVQMNALQHPNVQLIFALPTGKVGNADDSPISHLSDDQLALVHEEIARKSENLYHRISLDGATAIRINTIREIGRAHV